MQTLLKNTVSKKNVAHVLGLVMRKDGVWHSTDMDVHVSLSDATTSLPDGLYNAALIKAGVFNLDGLSLSEFPMMLVRGEKTVVSNVSVADLSYISKAMSTEETRYYLNGICFNNSHMVATNGHIMHIAEHRSPLAADAILPSRAVTLILSAAKECKVSHIDIVFYTVERVESYNGKQITYATCTIGGYTISTKLIDGQFPDYNRVQPKETDLYDAQPCDLSEMNKHLKALKAAVKAENGSAVRFMGTQAITYPYTCDSGLNVPEKTGFSLEYFMTTALDGGVARFNRSCGSPSLFERGHLRGVIMPMRV